MRRLRTAGLTWLLAFTGTAVLFAANAHAQESVPGDACSTAGLFRQSSGASPANSGYTLFCDGTRWVGMIEYRSTGDLYFSSSGAIALPDGTTGQRPSPAIEGMIRYNTSLDTFEGYVDDGTPAWEDLLGGGSGGGAIDDLTDAVTDYTNDNMRIGNNTALFAGATGNLYIGETAGSAGTTNAADNNIAIGHAALDALTVGYENIAIGVNSLTTNGWGGANVGLGTNALQNTDGGSQNVSIGTGSMRDNVGSSNNVMIGHGAAYAASTQDNSVGIGYLALANSNGDNNIAIGYQAGDGLSSGGSNIIIGYDVDAPSASSNGQITIGNLFFGTAVGTGTTVSTGNAGVGVAVPAARFHVRTTSTAGNAALEGIRIQHEDTNSAGANGIGTYLSMTAESDSNGVFPEIARIQSAMNDAANGSKDSYLAFYTLGPNAGAGSNTATEKMVLDSSGALFVDGVISSEVALRFYNNIGPDITNASSTSGSNLNVVGGEAANSFLNLQSTAAVGTSDYIKFSVGNDGATEAMRINTSGYVGILNNAPNVALDVTGDIEYTGTIADVSDRRLKKDIQNLMAGQLDKVLRLQGVSFKMIEDAAGRTEFGLIAQDVQQIFPELVQESSGGTLSLNYTGLIAPMIEAMKEQQAQIDDLKAMNAALVSRIEKLEAATAQ